MNTYEKGIANAHHRLVAYVVVNQMRELQLCNHPVRSLCRDFVRNLHVRRWRLSLRHQTGLLVSFAPSLRNRSFDAPEPVELLLSRRTSFRETSSMLGLGDESGFALGDNGGDDTEGESGRKFVGLLGLVLDIIVLVFRPNRARY